jgi:hypothetical protein
VSFHKPDPLYKRKDDDLVQHRMGRVLRAGDVPPPRCGSGKKPMRYKFHYKL